MRRLAVLGFPVGHSRSPAMQNAALAELGLSEEWEYGAIEVAPEEFEARVRELAAAGYVGANVTVPHKEAALALADSASEAASQIGAANTLSFAPGAETGVATIAAENTDAGGLLASLPSPPHGKRALVLGAGGAARAVIWALVGAGAEVAVWNRTPERAAAVTAELGGVDVTDPEPAGFELIVNTSAAGLHGEDPFAQLPLAPGDFRADQAVVDMVYGERPSALLAAAAERGAVTVDGLEILVQQGALSLELWTGRRAPLAVMRAAARG
ncbi:MAG: shikimate dehydrogenase [Solirubrobacterales bacterium]